MTHQENLEVLKQHTDEANFASVPSDEIAVNNVDVEYVEAAYYDRQASLSQDVPDHAPATGTHPRVPEQEFA